MMTRYISSLLFLSALGLSAPAMAECRIDHSAGSTTQSCESGVKVYRGQQNGPDIRYAILQQNREIAEARARATETRRVQAQQPRRVRITTVNQNNRRGRQRFVNGAFLGSQFGFGSQAGFGNVRNGSFPVVGGGFGTFGARSFGARGLSGGVSTGRTGASFAGARGTSVRGAR